MRQISCHEEPIVINGLLGSSRSGAYHRLPESMFGKVSELVTKYGHRASGGRIRFRTNSTSLKIGVSLLTLTPTRLLSLVGSAGCAVLSGLKEKSSYLGCVAPMDYEHKYSEEIFQLNGEMQDITIYLPRTECVEDVFIWIDRDAAVEGPTPFDFEKPIVFYGSSITEGSACSQPANSYTALTARCLNVDFIDLGFSGAARGEKEMAEFIAGLTMQVFVYDYDHNAPSLEHFNRTHELFYQLVREKNPKLPILMMSRPDTDLNPKKAQERKQVILSTYQHAIKNGDRHLYFLDGETFFGDSLRFACTVDTLHPNDLGMIRMAQIVSHKLKEIML